MTLEEIKALLAALPSHAKGKFLLSMKAGERDSYLASTAAEEREALLTALEEAQVWRETKIKEEEAKAEAFRKVEQERILSKDTCSVSFEAEEEPVPEVLVCNEAEPEAVPPMEEALPVTETISLTEEAVPVTEAVPLTEEAVPTEAVPPTEEIIPPTEVFPTELPIAEATPVLAEEEKQYEMVQETAAMVKTETTDTPLPEKAETFTFLHDWMRTELQLRGATEKVYAFIYSFTKNGKTYFGGRSYLAQTLGFCTRTIAYALKTLLNKGLLVQTKNGRSSCTYTAIRHPTQLPLHTPTLKRTSAPHNQAQLSSQTLKTPENVVDPTAQQWLKDYLDPFITKIAALEKQTLMITELQKENALLRARNAELEEQRARIREGQNTNLALNAEQCARILEGQNTNLALNAEQTISLHPAQSSVQKEKLALVEGKTCTPEVQKMHTYIKTIKDNTYSTDNININSHSHCMCVQEKNTDTVREHVDPNTPLQDHPQYYDHTGTAITVEVLNNHKGSPPKLTAQAQELSTFFMKLWHTHSTIFNFSTGIRDMHAWVRTWNNCPFSKDQVEQAITNVVEGVKNKSLLQRYIPKSPDAFVINGWLQRSQAPFKTDEKQTNYDKYNKAVPESKIWEYCSL
jgi:hypothetical protein